MSSVSVISSVLEKSKEFEQLVTTYDPIFNGLIAGLEVVKDFIAEKKLILYGGTAIDMALRLKGDKIYPDDLLPDLDFYSANNVEHAYQLADILYNLGYKDARAINAQHMETMRVDLVDNHFIADITYRPASLFNKLPFLIYNGMRIIHPHFQRIDVHSSLSFPYDNVPREVIFERWSKDIKRFNKLAQYYPIEDPVDILPTRTLSVTKARSSVLTGFAGYAMIYNEFVREMKALNAEISPEIVPATFKFSNDTLIFDTLNQIYETVHYDLEKAVSMLNLQSVRYFEPYINMIPPRVEGLYDNIQTVVYSTKHRLISTNSIKILDSTFRVTNIQYLLKHFLSMYFVNIDSPKIANTYLKRYISLLKMISCYETALVKLTGDNAAERAVNSVLFPTIETYGNENINLARTIALNQLYNELNNEPRYKIPSNYYPGRSIQRGCGHPPFNPNEVEFFQEEGREISK